MATQYMKDKPTAENFAYAYAETADGALVRVPKDKVTGEGVTVDSALSETSTNPVQNKVVAEKINELSEELDSLEIGGRNLIPNTKSMSGWHVATTTTNISFNTDSEGVTVATWAAMSELKWNALGTRDAIQFSEVRGKTVTFSCLVRSDDYASINAEKYQGLTIAFALCTATSTNRTLYGSTNWYTTVLSDEWTKLSWTGVLEDDFFSEGTGTIDDTDRMYLQLYNRSTYSMQVKKVKLELGNVATDWSPAPEDSTYTLPIATADTLGGVMPVAKTDAMTQSVGVDANGALYTASGGGSGSAESTIIFDSGEITEEVNLIGPIDVSGYSKIRILGKAYPSVNSAGKRAAMLCFEGSSFKKILCGVGSNKLFDTAGNPVGFVIYVDKGADAWTTEAYSGYNAGGVFDSVESYLGATAASSADGSSLIYTNLYNEEQMYICAQDDFLTRPWGIGTRIMVVGDI